MEKDFNIDEEVDVICCGFVVCFDSKYFIYLWVGWEIGYVFVCSLVRKMKG